MAEWLTRNVDFQCKYEWFQICCSIVILNRAKDVLEYRQDRQLAQHYMYIHGELGKNSSGLFYNFNDTCRLQGVEQKEVLVRPILV